MKVYIVNKCCRLSWCRSVWGGVLVVLLHLPSLVAQPQVVEDSVQIQRLNQQFAKAIEQKKYEQAASYGEQALATAKKHPNVIPGKINTMVLFGKLCTCTNKVSEALSHYLEAEGLSQSFNFQLMLLDIYDGLGDLYQAQQLPKKAIQYFRQSYQIRQKKNYQRGLAHNLEQIAQNYFISEDYVKSALFYEKLLGFYRKKRQKEQQIRVTEQIALIHSFNEDYNKAVSHQLTLLNHYKKKKDIIKMSGVYNDLGFLYQRKRDVQTAISYFSLSSELIQQQRSTVQTATQTTLLINTGVAYTHIEAFNKARKYFKLALKNTQGQPLKQAEVYNYLASNHYLGGNNRQAITEVEKAINIAFPKKAWSILLVSYDLLSRIHQAETNKKKSLEYVAKYKRLKSQLQRDRQQKLNVVTRNLRLMERREAQIKNLLAEKRQLKELKDVQEKQKKDLALKNNLLELQNKELALLKKAKELDQSNAQRILLEKVRQEQALLISQGKLREANLEKIKTLTALELARKETEKKLQEKENQKKLALLEKEKKIQQQEIRQQKAKARYAIGIIILVVSILGLVLALLLITNKNRQRLKKQKALIEDQNAEIISQNEELYQQQEEITTQRDNIEEKNHLLNRQNQHIQQSIKAALTIQEAVLPDASKVSSLLPEHFVLYQSKDVVSGDFYWLEKMGDQIILAAIDCTGHGVPGAFMSVIGNSLLNSIVRERHILEPKEILSALNTEIEKVLKQKEKGYKNGMDLSLITWTTKDDHVDMKFAGAKRPIYHYKQEEDTLHKIQGSRYSIGFENPQFDQKTLVLDKGDTLYMSSDGFVDQNNAKRKKIGSKKFEQLLCDHQDLPMAAQKDLLEQTLNRHMQGVDQRDDILVIGLKF
ncbi:hypothetical protein BKI52_13835 [marine bacterium AO1-C]|nr:hypothetical protein BKI52_13835 [marine bacterium AO1-C]